MMTYSTFFARLTLYYRLFLTIVVIGIIGFLLSRIFVSQQTFTYNFPNLPSIHLRGPVDKANNPQPLWFLEGEYFLPLHRTQTWFTIRLPSRFQRVRINTIHQNKDQLELNLKMPDPNLPIQFNRFPLYNQTLQSLDWPKLTREDGWILYINPGQETPYRSLDEFVDNPPLDSSLLVFGDLTQLFPADFDLQKLKTEDLNEQTMWRINGFDYLLAYYRPPQQIGEWMVSEWEVPIPASNRVEGAGSELSFYFEGYGQEEESLSLIKSFSLTLIK